MKGETIFVQYQDGMGIEEVTGTYEADVTRYHKVEGAVEPVMEVEYIVVDGQEIMTNKVRRTIRVDLLQELKSLGVTQ